MFRRGYRCAGGGAAGWLATLGGARGNVTGGAVVGVTTLGGVVSLPDSWGAFVLNTLASCRMASNCWVPICSVGVDGVLFWSTCMMSCAAWIAMSWGV